MLENTITAEERFTLVILANRVQIAGGEREGDYYAPAPLDPGLNAPERNSDTVAAVCRLISGASLTSTEVQRLVGLAHVVDRDIAPGVVLSRPANGYGGRCGRYEQLVTKLSMLADAKREADRFFEEYGDHSDEEHGA